VWKWISSVFRGRSKLSDLNSLALSVKCIMELDLSTEEDREKHRGEIVSTLKELGNGIEIVQESANGYPENPISAKVWLRGFRYGELAFYLTSHFNHAGWLEYEEKSSYLWVLATLAVCSHYPNMVGPAMVANADCHDRLGEEEVSTQMYSSVIKDFASILDNYKDNSDRSLGEEESLIESLNTAAERLLKRGMKKLDSIDLVEIKSITKGLLMQI
jgi:hypothetical protein